MKRLISLTGILGILLLAVCINASVIYAGEIAKYDLEITDIYDDIVKEYVLQQRNCIDNGVKFVTDENASEELNNYLRIQETTKEIYIKKNNYNAVAEILEKELINDVIYFKVNVKANWTYEGSKDDSGYGKNVDVLVEKNTGKIVDYYDINSFTLAARGEIDIRNKENRLTKEIVETAAEKYEKKISDAKKQVEDEASSTSITGGADGPTDIVTKSNTSIWIVVGLGAFALVLIVLLIAKKKRRKL